ncbi:hypothetical protein EMEDMD4_1170004 [Sinorhizobium medicae]|uniref:Uncharacterized protein n=1 Tax=Sinorhizobium medicae TaxID=110321 RepID=A0A508WQ33_9HYPH|nr:hypothetical protein EMEDMD4_1170004 [Sinorhizobium medicae]
MVGPTEAFKICRTGHGRDGEASAEPGAHIRTVSGKRSPTDCRRLPPLMCAGQGAWYARASGKNGRSPSSLCLSGQVLRPQTPAFLLRRRRTPELPGYQSAFNLHSIHMFLRHTRLWPMSEVGETTGRRKNCD